MAYEMLTKEAQKKEISISVWNCDGCLWTQPGRLEEVMRGRDIIMFTETHESRERGLPYVRGYQWESTYRQTTGRHGTSRGSGGIAILVRRELQDRVSVVQRDPKARYMWVRIQLATDSVIHIAVCYFPPRGSIFAGHTEMETAIEAVEVEAGKEEREDEEGAQTQSPFSILSEDILHYTALGEILLVGDFNARTQSRQCEIYDWEDPAILQAIEPEEVGLGRISADTGSDSTRYGSHLLALGSAHHLMIYNGMPRWPESGGYTCFQKGGKKGQSTVDYVLGSLAAMDTVSSFTIPRRPIGADHTYLSLSLRTSLPTPPPPTHSPHTTIHFTEELSVVYRHHVYAGIRQLDPDAPLSTLTTEITTILHSAALESFPVTTHSAPRTGAMPQNRWYDDECRQLYQNLRAQQALGSISERQMRRRMGTLTRRKRRAFEEAQWWDMYHTLMSRHATVAWRDMRQRSIPTPIEDPDVWRTYTERLYQIPDQPPIPHPAEPRPTTPTFFTIEMVRKGIQGLQHRRAADHTELRGEHFIYAATTLAPLITHLFNRALAEGLPDSWTMHTIVPLHKAGDRMDPANYRTVMIGHLLAKTYGAVLEAELSRYAERESLRSPGQAGFRRTFSTVDHIFTLRCLIEQSRSRGRRLYCCFVDFRKAFDTVPRERLFRRLTSLGVPSEMIWAIYALYERVSGRVRCPGGLSDSIASTIGVKQGCPLSPTLFGLYIDEVDDFIQRGGGAGVDLSGTQIHIMLYADDIVLLAESQEDLQHHLRALGSFCTQRGLSVNLGKTKVLIFHTSGTVRRRTAFMFEDSQIEIADSYVYLGITFTARSGRFSMTQAARDRTTRAFAALAMLERGCHQTHFQEPRTKGWLFDTLVTPALLYAAPVWAPGLSGQSWSRIERPHILMLSRMIRSKQSVPHDILRAEFDASPMTVEALFQTIGYLHRLRDMSADRLPRLAMEASRQLAEAGDQRVWYATTNSWIQSFSFTMDRLPPSRYDPDAPRGGLSHSERNTVLRQEIKQRYIERTWITPSRPLDTKMAYYRDHFLMLTLDGFIQRPRYMDVYLPHGTRVDIGQLRVSSHQLEIETGRAAGIPREDRICRLCRQGVECESHFICRCPHYTEIRARYPTLFGRPEVSLHSVMTSPDQRLLGRFLRDMYQHRERGLQMDSTQGRQTQLTDFFRPTAPIQLHASSSQGVTLARAEEIRAQRRPRIPGTRSRVSQHHRREVRSIRQRFELHILGRGPTSDIGTDDITRVLTTGSRMYHILHPPIITGWS